MKPRSSKKHQYIYSRGIIAAMERFIIILHCVIISRRSGSWSCFLNVYRLPAKIQQIRGASCTCFRLVIDTSTDREYSCPCPFFPIGKTPYRRRDIFIVRIWDDSPGCHKVIRHLVRLAVSRSSRQHRWSPKTGFFYISLADHDSPLLVQGHRPYTCLPRPAVSYARLEGHLWSRPSQSLPFYSFVNCLTLADLPFYQVLQVHTGRSSILKDLLLFI